MEEGMRYVSEKEKKEEVEQCPDAFQYLLSFSQGHLSSLLVANYPPLSYDALPHVNRLFATLSDHLRGANVSVEAAVHRFFDGLFPLVYTQLVNPGMAHGTGAPSSPSTTAEEEEGEERGGVGVGVGVGVDSERADCLRMTRQDINPFGPHPAAMAKELAEALGAGRHLGLALAAGLEPINATDHLLLSRECVRGLVRMVYCSHCRGLTLIKPCVGYCLNVLRGCLAATAELDQPWRRYAALLEQLTHAVAGHHSLELALLGVRGHVDEAMLYAQLHGPLITATVNAFQYLLSFSQGHLSSLLVANYPPLSYDALPHVNRLFATLSDHLRGANVSVEAAVHRFFDGLFPLVYTQLVNPGMAHGTGAPSSPSTTAEEEEGEERGGRADCLRMTRQDINPFGPHPAAMAKELAEALGAGRHLGLALAAGLEPINATDHLLLSRECVRGLVRMVYCSHCRGLTLIKPCVGYCLNVLRGCLAATAELDQPWRRYAALLEQLTHAVAGHHSLELALLGVRGHVDEAMLYAQLHGPLITAT
ncbi:hypothetical protein CRUP_012615, partial [Coryphaenoides rupestris]